MKSNRSKILAILSLLVISLSNANGTKLSAKELNGTSGRPMHVYDRTSTPDSLSAFERRQLKYAQRWENLIPKYVKTQFAGGMGMFSFGTGWEYGKNDQWETDLLFGFIPKHSSKHTRATMTLKQNFTP